MPHHLVVTLSNATSTGMPENATSPSGSMASNNTGNEQQESNNAGNARQESNNTGNAQCAFMSTGDPGRAQPRAR